MLTSNLRINKEKVNIPVPSTTPFTIPIVPKSGFQCRTYEHFCNAFLLLLQLMILLL